MRSSSAEVSRSRSGRAKEFCHGCPVRLDCLRTAFHFERQPGSYGIYGIWGGFSARDRRPAPTGWDSTPRNCWRSTASGELRDGVDAQNSLREPSPAARVGSALPAQRMEPKGSAPDVLGGCPSRLRADDLLCRHRLRVGEVKAVPADGAVVELAFGCMAHSSAAWFRVGRVTLPQERPTCACTSAVIAYPACQVGGRWPRSGTRERPSPPCAGAHRTGARRVQPGRRPYATSIADCPGR